MLVGVPHITNHHHTPWKIPSALSSALFLRLRLAHLPQLTQQSCFNLLRQPVQLSAAQGTRPQQHRALWEEELPFKHGGDLQRVAPLESAGEDHLRWDTV